MADSRRRFLVNASTAALGRVVGSPSFGTTAPNRSTTLVIRLQSRGQDTHKDAFNQLLLAVGSGNMMSSRRAPELQVRNEAGPWIKIAVPNGEVPEFPNLRLMAHSDTETSPPVKLGGWFANNRDEHLIRTVAVTFFWDGKGEEVVQTSVMNAYKFPGGTFMEKVAIGFCVPHGTQPVEPAVEYRDADLNHPWTNSVPEGISARRCDLHVPSGYIPSGQGWEFENFHEQRHRAIRLSALLNVKPA